MPAHPTRGVAGPSGPAGPAGPDGPVGGAGPTGPQGATSEPYVHVQTTPDDDVLVAHPLPYPPEVLVLDGDGDEIEGVVRYPPDAPSGYVRIVFASPFAYTAYLS